MGLVVACLTFLSVTIVAGLVSISLGPGADGRSATVVAILGAALTASVAGISAVVKITRVEQKVDHLSNGLMDDKINRGVHKAMDEREG